MVGELLLDTSALVGLLDRSQRVHDACAAFYASWEGPVATTEAVLTESTHLLSTVRRGGSTCLEFVLESEVLVVPSTPSSIRRCRNLMDKYADMDFADATLVVLAEDLNTDLVFTVDRDFDVYRIHGRKRFNMVPEL